MVPYVPRVRHINMKAMIQLSETLPQIKPHVRWDESVKRWRVYVGLCRTDFNMTDKAAAELWVDYTDGWYPNYCYHNCLANGHKPIYL